MLIDFGHDWTMRERMKRLSVCVADENVHVRMKWLFGRNFGQFYLIFLKV